MKHYLLFCLAVFLACVGDVSVPSPSGPMVSTAWAHIDKDGKIIAHFNIREVSHASPGINIFFFDHDPASDKYSVICNSSLNIICYISSRSDNSFTAVTQDETGTIVAQPVDVVVFGP